MNNRGQTTVSHNNLTWQWSDSRSFAGRPDTPRTTRLPNAVSIFAAWEQRPHGHRRTPYPTFWLSIVVPAQLARTLNRDAENVAKPETIGEPIDACRVQVYVERNAGAVAQLGAR